jgi:hypothetical protein
LNTENYSVSNLSLTREEWPFSATLGHADFRIAFVRNTSPHWKVRWNQGGHVVLLHLVQWQDGIRHSVLAAWA